MNCCYWELRLVSSRKRGRKKRRPGHNLASRLPLDWKRSWFWIRWRQRSSSRFDHPRLIPDKDFSCLQHWFSEITGLGIIPVILLERQSNATRKQTLMVEDIWSKAARRSTRDVGWNEITHLLTEAKHEILDNGNAPLSSDRSVQNGVQTR